MFGDDMMGMTMTDVNVETEQGAQMAFAYVSKQFQREVGVAIRIPRQRRHKDEKLKWRIQAFKFLDSSQFANLEALLIQHAPTVVCMPAPPKGGGEGSAGDVKRLRDLFETHRVDLEEHARANFSNTSIDDLESILPRLLGTENISAQRTLLGEGTVLVRALGGLLHHLNIAEASPDEEECGAYCLEPGCVDDCVQMDQAAMKALVSSVLHNMHHFQTL